MDQQTLITLVGLAVAIVAMCVAMASFLYLFARNVKEDTQTQNAATREQLGERIDGVKSQLGERIDGLAAENATTREQLGERIDQLDSRLIMVEGKIDTMAKADDMREGFAMLRGSLDTLERRTFDIATGAASEG